MRNDERGGDVALPIPNPVLGRLSTRLRAAPGAGDETRALGDHRLNPGLVRVKDDFYRDAAVLVPIVERAGGEDVILTVRNAGLSSHPGQIAFPGGKIDAEDADPAAAAVREAREEIGLAADHIDVIGYSDTYLSRTGYRIVPVVARVDPGFALTLNLAEVDEVFHVPAGHLFDPANVRQGTRTIGGREARFYEIRYGKRYIWGVTAGIIKSLTDRMVV